MNVAYDVSFTGSNLGGTGTYAKELRRSLAQLTDLQVIDISNNRASILQTMSWLLAGARRASRAVGATLLHVPAPVPPMRPGLPMVVTVHDVAVFEFPEDFAPEWREFQRWLLPVLCGRSQRVITGTEHAKAAIVERFGLRPEKIAVTPYGVSAPPTPASTRAERPSGDPAVLFAGAPLRRKNLDVVLRALATPIGRETGIRLLISGAVQQDFPHHATAARRLGVADRVDWLGNLDASRMDETFAAAQALVYPSLAEGFGFPPLEAMARGVPVIAARASCLPEVLDDAAVLIDPNDESAFADAIGRVLIDEKFRKELVARGKQRAAAFSWGRCAQMTLDVYRQAIAA